MESINEELLLEEFKARLKEHVEKHVVVDWDDFAKSYIPDYYDNNHNKPNSCNDYLNSKNYKYKGYINGKIYCAKFPPYYGGGGNNENLTIPQVYEKYATELAKCDSGLSSSSDSVIGFYSKARFRNESINESFDTFSEHDSILQEYLTMNGVRVLREKIRLKSKFVNEELVLRHVNEFIDGIINNIKSQEDDNNNESRINELLKFKRDYPKYLHKKAPFCDVVIYDDAKYSERETWRQNVRVLCTSFFIGDKNKLNSEIQNNNVNLSGVVDDIELPENKLIDKFGKDIGNLCLEVVDVFNKKFDLSNDVLSSYLNMTSDELLKTVYDNVREGMKSEIGDELFTRYSNFNTTPKQLTVNHIMEYVDAFKTYINSKKQFEIDLKRAEAMAKLVGK